jgi:hypothetical protein
MRLTLDAMFRAADENERAAAQRENAAVQPLHKREEAG